MLPHHSANQFLNRRVHPFGNQNDNGQGCYEQGEEQEQACVAKNSDFSQNDRLRDRFDKGPILDSFDGGACVNH
ncbi:hypothetical protein D3C76_1824950 [compost metagenome]